MAGIASILLSPYTIPIAVVLFFIVPYFTSNTALKDIPGPFAAKFTRLWLMLQARLGVRYLSVHEAHAKYGKLVRIQPDHVSIADETAINSIYGHGNGFLKSYAPLHSQGPEAYINQGLLRCFRFYPTRTLQYQRSH